MGVLMQAFYWDCPGEERRAGQWWNHVASKLDGLREAGFTALWLPPASKAANGGSSMGYDVYDYYDLGKYDQKGSIKTWFGSESELRKLIDAAHRRHMTVYADLVLNHNSGADEAELNPITDTMRWTRFQPKSGLFTRDWTCFNPSPYPEMNPSTYGDMPDLCHINPRVSTGILNHAKWMVEEIGFDGFRYDFVKGFGSWIVRAIHDRRYTRGGRPVPLFGVGECWDSDATIDAWLDSVNRYAERRVAAFDFGLRGRLKDLCDTPGFDVSTLARGGVLSKDRPEEAVTFVENHDFRGADCVVNDKILAYAFVLTEQGYPCVFWKDYFVYGLAKPGEPDGIERLVRIHERYAGGATEVLAAEHDLYVMRRTGFERQPGLVFALNNSGAAIRRSLGAPLRNVTLKARAWTGPSMPAPIATDGQGAFTVEVPPRGYAIWAP